MTAALADVEVTGYEPLIGGLDLPDPDDRHVLAAAITAGATVIVTKNLTDFPAAALAPTGVRAVHPDAFLTSLAHQHARVVVGIITRIAATGRAPTSPDRVLDSLATEAPGTAKVLRDLVPTP